MLQHGGSPVVLLDDEAAGLPRPGLGRCAQERAATSSSPQQTRTANGVSLLVTRCPCPSLACIAALLTIKHCCLPASESVSSVMET